MGHLIVEQIVSADGYAEDRHGSIDFFENARSINDADVDQLRLLDDVGAIVLGRRTFELFERYWADMDPAREPVAAPINAIPKYVVSNSMPTAPWGRKGDHATVLAGDGAEAVGELKRRIGQDVIVWGSLTLADSLLRAGLVDILRLRILPMLIGAGRSIAPPDLGPRPLRLRGTRAYEDGFLVVEYAFA